MISWNHFFFVGTTSDFCKYFEFSSLFQREFRTVLQLLLEQLFLVWEMRTRGGCSRGLRTGEQFLIWLWRVTFFWTSFWNPLSHLKWRFWMENAPQMEPKLRLLGTILQRKCKIGKVCLDCAGVYGLHISPSRIALRATQKSMKNRDIFQNQSFKQQ